MILQCKDCYEEIRAGWDGLIKNIIWHFLWHSLQDDHIKTNKVCMEENDNTSWNKLEITRYTHEKIIIYENTLKTPQNLCLHPVSSNIYFNQKKFQNFFERTYIYLEHTFI